MPSNLSFFGYGSGPNKLDRVTLKLNLNNLATADEGKRRLMRAVSALAAEMAMEVPASFQAAVNAHRGRMLREPPAASSPDARRTIMESAQGRMVLQLLVEQSRLSAIVVHFRNRDASDLW
jgi:hypothetical protein